MYIYYGYVFLYCNSRFAIILDRVKKSRSKFYIDCFNLQEKRSGLVLVYVKSSIARFGQY